MNKKGNTAIIVILSVIGIVLLAGLTYLFGQNQKINNELLRLELDKKMATPSGLTTTPTVLPNVTQATESTSVVIFEAEGSFTQNDKNQLRSRVSEPFSDYYRDLNGSEYLSSISFYINQEASKSDYPFGAKYIFRDGVNGGFLITKTDGAIDWWVPECIAECPFSDSFKQKYPEIVAKLTP